MSLQIVTITTLLCLLFPSVGLAKEPSKQPKLVSANVSIGGNYIVGNLNQASLNSSGHIDYSSRVYGNDLLWNGFRFWTKTPMSDQLTRVADDIFVTSLPFWYVYKKIYVHGLFRYEKSQLHQLDNRFLAGSGVGYAPVRKKNFLVRTALGMYAERSMYPTSDFSLDVQHDGAQRDVPRLGIVSNGWFRLKNSPISMRYFMTYFLNPRELQDYRFYLDSKLQLKLMGPLSLQLAATYNQSTVVPVEVDAGDLRTSVGLSIRYPVKK